MSEQAGDSKCVSRGRRYSPAEKAAILQDAQEGGVAQAAQQHRCSAWTIYDWRKKAKRASQQPPQPNLMTLCKPEPEPGDEPGARQAASEQQERHQLILTLWRQQPGLGPSQIRNQLKRKGLKASVSTVRAVMEEHGYVQPKVRRKEHPGRYEAVRPLQLCHLDFYHFYVHRQKQCLLLIVDDFSRFITGWQLLKSEIADGVITQFEQTVTRFGKPEAVMTDRGSAFHSWQGISRFERLLEEYGIDHYLAREAAVNGKAEALNAAIQKELIRQVEFIDLADCQRQIARWVEFYNYKRTHHALGGLLVPADRFHGWAEQTLRRIEQGQGADAADLRELDGRGLELFKVVSSAGQVAVYLMGRKVMG